MAPKVDFDDDKEDKALNLPYTMSSATQTSSVVNGQGQARPPQASPFRISVEECAALFKANIEVGLTEEEAKTKLETYGPNKLQDPPGISILDIIIRQTCDAMVLVLIIAMSIAFGIKDWISGGVIAFVIGLNVAVGTFQGYNAEKTMNSLRSLTTPSARVIRGGAEVAVASEELVPGDIIVFKMGDTIAADVRLFESINLDTDEALLTGEALPVSKKAEIIFDKDMPVGDRINMAFTSTLVVKGRGKGIVTSTGMNTEIGRIAKELKGGEKKVEIKPRQKTRARRIKSNVTHAYGHTTRAIGNFLGITVGTPLQQLLSRMAIGLFIVSVVWAIVVLAAQKFDVNRQVGVYAIAVALSMIPSSLVVVLTMTLAVGSKVMAQRNVIIRKLNSLETLGSITNICSDKTGTLTQGRMVAKTVWIPHCGTYQTVSDKDTTNPYPVSVSFSNVSPLSVSEKPNEEDPYGPTKYNSIEEIENLEAHDLFVRSSALVNGSSIITSKNEKGVDVHKGVGEPTEIAITAFVTKIGQSKDKFINELNEEFIHEFPFDSGIKRMTTIYKNGDIKRAYTKGATERVIKLCKDWYTPTSDTPQPLDDEAFVYLENNMNAMALQGLRVLAVAYREVNYDFDYSTEEARGEVERNLTFLGLFGIYDPPRPESADAVERFHTAGITVHMLTGDHPGTAAAIAKEIGIIPKDLDVKASQKVMTGQEFDSLTEDQIDQMRHLPLVIARCAPQTKVRMIDALHRRKTTCAMTGDGVNDSPSLKRADVGIAMGINGSDVAKDASDIVLSDDNFASILNAVEEGRRIADNIQKFILHLLAGNVGQTIFLLCGLAFKDAQGFSVFPISPVEVLWVIMVTASFPAMGLGVEIASKDVMIRPPKPTKSIFSKEMILDIFVYGFIMAFLCMASFCIVVYVRGDGQLGEDCNEKYSGGCYSVFRARSTAFVIMTWGFLVLALEVIDLRRSFFTLYSDTPHPFRNSFLHVYRNPFLFWSIVLAFLTVFPVIYIPVINKDVFNHSPISWEWGLAFGFGLILFFGACEAYKGIKRNYYFRKEENLRLTREITVDYPHEENVV